MSEHITFEDVEDRSQRVNIFSSNTTSRTEHMIMAGQRINCGVSRNKSQELIMSSVSISIRPDECESFSFHYPHHTGGKSVGVAVQ